MKRLYFIFVITVILAPIIFAIYLKYDLVCAPRAILSSAIFGLIPLLCLSIAVLKKKKEFYYFSQIILIIEIIITPVIMIIKLGWEKFLNERLLAFFTFEGFAILQFLIILLILKGVKNQKNNIA